MSEYVRPTFVPVKEITDAQLAGHVSEMRLGEHAPVVLRLPQGHDTSIEALKELEQSRIDVMAKAAEGFIQHDGDAITFGPSIHNKARATADVGFHFDGLSSLIGHSTVKGICDAYFVADKGTPYPQPAPPAARTLHISTLWEQHGLIDPQYTRDHYYAARLTVGSFVVFSSGNIEGDPQSPVGYWHQFISRTEDRTSTSTIFHAPNSPFIRGVKR